MLQPSSNPYDLSIDVADQIGVRSEVRIPAGYPAQSAGPEAADPQGVRARSLSGVVILEVARRLGEVVEDLDLAVQLALADGPRGVVCDLPADPGGDGPDAVEVLATLGRHVRDWPGIPVAVACPDAQVRDALRAHPLGRHLIVTASILPAVTAVLASSTRTVERLRLAPHPTAQRASRDFVTRTLLDWGLSRVIRLATLVVSELVMSSTVQAGTDIDLSVAWNRGALRLSVRNYSPGLPRQRYSALGLHGRGLTMVAGLTRSFGVLPAADGGKVVWAVLEVPGHAHRPAVAALRPRRQFRSHRCLPTPSI